MGVKNLWPLVMPIGRRISIETLEGKILAIDASVWLIQFIKAMRDKESGTSTPAAHLIGFFRRICKLRFHGIRPIFVFDGSTPEIKQRELRERRKRRGQFGAGAGEDSVQRIAKRILAKQLLKKEGGKFTITRSSKGLESNDEEEGRKNSGKHTVNSSCAPGFFDPALEAENQQEQKINPRSESMSIPPISGLTSTKDGDGDIIELLEDDDYLEEASQSEKQSDWDTVVIGDNTSSRSQDKMKLKRPLDTSNDVDFDIDYVASLSSSERKDWVEKAQRKRRMLARRDFMKVAYDTDSFSHCQLKNFLHSSKLNQDIQTMASKAVKSEGNTGTCATDRTKRIIFEKDDSASKPKKKKKQELLKEYKKQKLSILESDNVETDNEEEILWENGNGEENDFVKLSAYKSKVSIDDDSTSEDQEMQGGFFKAQSVSNNPDMSGGFISLININKKSEMNEERASKSIEIDDFEYTKIPVEAEDKKLAQELQDESLALAMQSAEYSDGEGGFLPTNNSIASETEEFSAAESQRRTDSIVTMQNNSGETKNKKTEGVIINVDEQNVESIGEDRDISEEDDDDDDDDEIDWEDGNVDTNAEVTVDTAVTSLKLPVAIQNKVYKSSGSDILDKLTPRNDLNKKESELKEYDPDMDWEEGIDNVNNCQLSEVSESQWEGSNKGEKAKVNANAEAQNDNDTMIGSNLWSKDLKRNSSTSDEVTVALEHAQETASKLTNWAGRAFRRAVAQHAEETGGTVPDAAKPKAIVLDDDEYEEVEEISPNISTPKNDETSLQKLEKQGDIALTRSGSPVGKGGMDSMEAIGEKYLSDYNNQSRDMDEMKAECIRLCDLFGVPYVESPAEAEAQCVELEKLGLVDGIVTEDSDAFVFGGQMIFKNIFSDLKYVEVYNSKDAEKEMRLTRDGLVGLAMLLGGDYTEGIRGVGIVNGMEIIEAFDVSEGVKDGLSSFRKWLDGFVPPGDEDGSKQQVFHRKHLSARNRWVAPKHFPDPRVLTAYLNPVVDSSRKPFTWGAPDLEGLVLFCRRQIGWTTEETEALLKPVLKKLKESGSMRQTRIDSFMRYEDGIKFADIRSKRLRDILSGQSSSHDGTPMNPEDSLSVFPISNEKEQHLGPRTSISRATNIKTADLVKKILPKAKTMEEGSTEKSSLLPPLIRTKANLSKKKPPAYQRHSKVAVTNRKEKQSKKSK